MIDQKLSRRKNLFWNIAINVVAPVLILTQFSNDKFLGPVWGLVVALAFPTIYGLWEFRKARKVNFFSALGFVSILLTGGIGLLQLENRWIVVKETSVPLLIAIAVLISARTRHPLVRTFFAEILDLEKIDAAFTDHGHAGQFAKKLTNSNYFLAGAFLLSAMLNMILALVIMKSDPGTIAYNAELGRMTALSYPVIVLPTMVILVFTIYYLIGNIKQQTGKEIEDFVKL